MLRTTIPAPRLQTTLPLHKQPLERADGVGPAPCNANHVMVEYMSKWVEVVPVPDCSSETTAREFLTRVIARYGVPAEVITDNGPSFLDHFIALCDKWHIRHRPIQPLNPRANGQAERAVQTVKLALSVFIAKMQSMRRWDIDGLVPVVMGYNFTPQAATGMSPAQVLYAHDPALDAAAYLSRQKPIALPQTDFTVQHVAREYVARAALAQQIGVQVARSLELAQQRNVNRFRALRSGHYIPRVHHFKPGDFVYVLQDPDRLASLELPAQDDVMQVVRVDPPAALVLRNQLGQLVRRNMRDCAPCYLPNVDGAVHADRRRPPLSHACKVCNLPGDAHVMLLCDECNSGYHTYCLTPPLGTVPDGVWLCPTCVDLGVTAEQVQQRQAHFRAPGPVDKPRMYMPSPKRVKQAHAAARQWHGKVVVRTRGHNRQYGRVLFQGADVAPWFNIVWQGGEVTPADGRTFRSLAVLDDTTAPVGLVEAPALVLAAMAFTPPHPGFPWACDTVADVASRLTVGMPGEWDVSYALGVVACLSSARSRCWDGLNVDTGLHVEPYRLLLSCLDLARAGYVLLPWEVLDGAVTGVFQQSGVPVITNRWPAVVGADTGGGTWYHPLEQQLWALHDAQLNAVVVPACGAVMDLVLPVALWHASMVVCAQVPAAWVNEAPLPRMLWLHDLVRQGRVHRLYHDNGRWMWLLLFADSAARVRLLHPWARGDRVARHSVAAIRQRPGVPGCLACACAASVQA